MQAYAREHLHKQGEWNDVRRQHAEHFLSVVEGLLDRLPGQLELARMRVEADYENIRSALAWALETGDTWLGLRIAGALWRYWFAHSPFPECLSWLERFIAAAGEPTCREEQRALAEAWTGVVAIRHRLDQFERAKEAGETAMALWRVVGDETEIADAMMNLANPLAALCEYARADELLRASLAIHRAMWHQEGMVLCLLNLGVLLYDRNRPHDALECYEQSLALSREAGETDLARALTWNNMGEALIVLDRPTDALAMAEPAYRLFVRYHDTFGIAATAFTLARAHWRLSAGIEASKYATEAERHFRTLGNLVQAARAQCVRAGVAFCEDNLSVAYQDLSQALADLTSQSRASDLPQWLIERVAVHAYREGHVLRAAHLLGAARRRWDAVSAPVDPAERDLGHRTLRALGSVLGKVRLNELLREGMALANDEVLHVAWQALGR